MRIQVGIENYKLVAKLSISLFESFDGESIDDDMYDRFARNKINGFMKAERIGKRQIKYTGPVGVSLAERMKKPITAREFLMIIHQIVVAVQKAGTYRLRVDRIWFDISHVFINEVTKELQFIYVPAEKCKIRADVLELMDTIAYAAQPSGPRDEKVVADFIKKLRTVNMSGLNEIEKFIQATDREAYDEIKRLNSGQTGRISDKRYTPQQDDDATDLLREDDDEATGLLYEDEDDDEATGLLYDEEQGTELLDDYDEDDDDETGLLSEDETMLLVEEFHYATLTRELTGEVIKVNKAVFRVGKERSYVDFFVSNNNAISRSHADIVKRGTRFFVIDLNSKNHTYINGEQVTPRCEVEIRNGDILKLANEEFIFNT